MRLRTGLRLWPNRWLHQSELHLLDLQLRI
jgi:hypothetical protein